MRQPHLILITGLPGTGKSTLARSLARHFALPLICKDTIKEPLLEVIGATGRSESRRLSDASFAAMFALARDCLRAGTDVILEGNFRPGEHEVALSAAIDDANGEDNMSAPDRAVAAAFNSSVADADAAFRNDGADVPHAVGVTQILCRTPEPVRIERLRARANDPSRHAGHRDADLAANLAANLAADLAPNGTVGLASKFAVDLAVDSAPDPTAAPAPSTSDFLALPGGRFMFDSDGPPAQLQALLKSLEPSHRDNPHV